MLITISGISGSGKTLLKANLKNTIPKLRYVPSYTTRLPRGDTRDTEYIHVTDVMFDRMHRDDDFIWRARPRGSSWYGTRIRDIDVAVGNNDVWVAILTPDVLPILHAHAQSRGNLELVKSLYLFIDDEQEIRRRLVQRGDPPAEIEKSLESLAWNDLLPQLREYVSVIDALQDPEDVLIDATTKIKAPLLC